MRRPPLEDVTIVAIEQYGAGPWGSVHLADLGADVIKIEDPRSRGDVGRYVPPFQEGEDSLFFETFCHNKRSVSLDLTHPEARPVFEDIVRAADAVYSNLRGDGPEKLRIRYADLAERQPGGRVLLAHGLRHDRAARRGGRLRLHPAGLRGLDVADRRARRPARQDRPLARRHGDRLRGGARADVRALGRAPRRHRLRLRHLAVRDRDEPQHVRLDLAPLARLRAGAHRELRAPVDRAVPELPDAPTAGS